MEKLEISIDPRIAILILWCVFIVTFIILHSIRILLGGFGINSRRTIDGSLGESYEHLSEEQRCKIDKKRNDVLRRYLGRCSLVLNKKHMICLSDSSDGTDCSSKNDKSAIGLHSHEGGGESITTMSKYSIATNRSSGKFEFIVPSGKLDVFVERTIKEGPVEVVEVHEDSPLAGQVQIGDKLIAVDDEDMEQMSTNAIAMLLWSKGKNPLRKITIFRGLNNAHAEEENEASVIDLTSDDYTHVRIPYSGYDFVGLQVKERDIPTSTKRTGSRKRSLAHPRGQRGDPQCVEDGNQTTIASRKKDERRNVPGFCAICLGEFELSEKISWSSNVECTHVFHEECIVTWLNTLGRKSPKYQRFSDDPSVLQLLNYKLECPCCRQDFISGLVFEVDYGDRNV